MSLPEISRYTFGTGQVNDPNNSEHIQVTRAAMDAGVWFHTSSAYGNGSVFEVLRKAFAEDPAHIPRIIFKVDGRSASLLRETVDEQIQGTGVDRIDIAQLCGNPDPADLEPGSELHDTLQDLQDRGLVDSYVLENFWSFSPNTLRSLAAERIDGMIFYYNVVNREVSNILYKMLEARQTPILALRTLGGGLMNFGDTGDPEGARAALENLFARSGCMTRLEFRMRFLMSLPGVRTTIGATGRMDHLKSLLETSLVERPLDQKIVDEIKTLHRQWFGEKGLA